MTFRSALSTTSSRHLPSPPSFISSLRQRRGTAKRAGQDLERSVHAHLSSTLRHRFSVLLGPWFEYFLPGYPRPFYCQPDALVWDNVLNHLIIIEVKLSHTINAWWQVEHLYRPVIAAAIRQEDGSASPILLSALFPASAATRPQPVANGAALPPDNCIDHCDEVSLPNHSRLPVSACIRTVEICRSYDSSQPIPRGTTVNLVRGWIDLPCGLFNVLLWGKREGMDG